MRASTRRLITLLLSFLFLIGAFVVYASFLKPEYASVNVLRGTFASKSNLYDEQKKIIDNIQELLAKYQGATNIQDTVSLALPNARNEDILFYQMLNLAKIANLTLDALGVSGGASLAPGESGGKASTALPQIGTVQVNMRVKGSYDDLKRFLQIVETNVRILDAVTINFAPPGAAGKTSGGTGTGRGTAPAPAEPANTFTADIGIRAYYQSAPN